ncbi:hypothetical protein C3K47_06200 [Solitalea longa]|uniref:Uncharacterized protein n=2 Tax=Solitalea longa TaxID=2079460 RepID=A0A2S5A4W5_9SPHI|nr:hypothetical protein C3K47_06200 [Solitalea longa]
MAQRDEFKPKHSTILDASKGPKLMEQCSRAVPKDISNFWTLSEKDIDLLQRNLKKVLTINSKTCCSTGSRVSNLKDFAFQYVGVEIKNNRYIYLNAFSFDKEEDLTTFYKNWKSEPLIFCDGGKSFWGALFDPTELGFSELAINGVG